MTLKKILWAIKRHPFLYTSRFKLLSRNSTLDGIKNQTYNKHNKAKDIPQVFFDVNELIFTDSKPQKDLEKVIKISLWLHTYIKAGPGLSETSEKVLDLMMSGKGGVCSDMAQIFNNFCVINDIQVREWGVTRAPFDRTYGGHSFNEVYCKELNEWVLFDGYWCVYFKDSEGNPLSVTNFYQSVRDDKSITDEVFKRVQFLDEVGYKKNFFHLNNVPFLICNYSNKRYDLLLKYTKPRIPVFISHFMFYMLRISYHYRFPLDNYKKIFS